VNAKDDKGTTPLDWAILFGQPETAALLHKHGGKTAEELKAAGNSIHDAAYKGNIEAVKQHLAAGVDVNAKDSVGWTALHQAAYGAHKEPVELLIAEGADVNAKGDDGTTPLDVAIQLKHHPETADLLRKHGGKTGEELKAEGK
jgi:ankyrin repeat protein